MFTNFTKTRQMKCNQCGVATRDFPSEEFAKKASERLCQKCLNISRGGGWYPSTLDEMLQDYRDHAPREEKPASPPKPVLSFLPIGLGDRISSIQYDTMTTFHKKTETIAPREEKPAPPQQSEFISSFHTKTETIDPPPFHPPFQRQAVVETRREILKDKEKADRGVPDTPPSEMYSPHLSTDEIVAAEYRKKIADAMGIHGRLVRDMRCPKCRAPMYWTGRFSKLGGKIDNAAFCSDTMCQHMVICTSTGLPGLGYPHFSVLALR